MMLTCENCYKRRELAKCLDIHFDWLDCPYRCEYGDKMLTKFKQIGCKTISEFNELQRSEDE